MDSKYHALELHSMAIQVMAARSQGDPRAEELVAKLHERLGLPHEAIWQGIHELAMGIITLHRF